MRFLKHYLFQDCMIDCTLCIFYFLVSPGVLTGIAPREVLETDADIVVDNIHQALSIILDHHQ